MESSIMDNDRIDWKKIGHSKSLTENAAYSADNSQSSVAVASVATPQKPKLPTNNNQRSIARIKYPDDNTNNAAGANVSIRPLEEQKQNVPNVQKVETPVRKNQSDKGGMEMLDTQFILEVIEGLQGNQQTDLVMRKIGFNEILRRDLRSMIDSNALKVYAIDEQSLYGKNIQCHAMQELAQRTA